MFVFWREIIYSLITVSKNLQQETSANRKLFNLVLKGMMWSKSLKLNLHVLILHIAWQRITEDWSNTLQKSWILCCLKSLKEDIVSHRKKKNIWKPIWSTELQDCGIYFYQHVGYHYYAENKCMWDLKGFWEGTSKLNIPGTAYAYVQSCKSRWSTLMLRQDCFHYLLTKSFIILYFDRYNCLVYGLP